MQNPSLTILLPAHNAARTISEAIESVLKQTYQDFELWVLENGSTDETAEIAKAYMGRDSRVKVFELGSVGFQGALAWGLANSRSEFLARMDADDIALPERLSRQIQVFAEYPSIILCGTNSVSLTPFNHVIERKAPYIRSRLITKRHFSWGEEYKPRYFADPSAVFRRCAAIACGGYDEEFELGDISLWIRMLVNGTAYEIAEPLLIYRLTFSSMSKNPRFGRNAMRLRAKYGLAIPSNFDGDRADLVSTVRAESAFWLQTALIEFMSKQLQAGFRAVHRAACAEPHGGKTKHIVLSLARILRKTYLLKLSGTRYLRRPDLESYI